MSTEREVSKLKERFSALPGALQKQIMIRLGISMTGLILFVIILIFTWEFLFCLPCMIMAVFMGINGTSLFLTCAEGKYVVIRGTCINVEKAPLSRRVKSIAIAYDDVPILIPVKHKLKAPLPGDLIIIYMPEKAPVYDRDGGYHIHDYYAFEIERKVQTGREIISE